MNRGLIIKTVRETWLSTLLFGVGLFGVQWLLADILPVFYKDFSEHWLQVPFVRNILTAILGEDMGGAIGPSAIVSGPWAHPLVLALTWAHSIMVLTRMPATEIERGTIDMLLSLPVGRTRFYLCESIVGLAAGLGIMVAAVAGNIIGGRSAAQELRATPAQLAMVGANLYCLYVAVGGIACLASSLCNRRGPAVGIVLGVLLTSFLLNYLAPFDVFIKKMAVVSMLHYYRPLFVLKDAAWPISDMLVLVAVGALSWLAGAFVFARRDLCTV